MSSRTINDALAQAMKSEPSGSGRPEDSVGGGNDSAILRLIETANDAQLQKLREVAPILKKAVGKLRAGDPREAGRLSVEAMNIDPESAVATHVAAIAMAEMGALRLALDLYERAIRLDPTDADMYQNLGLAAWGLQEFGIAEQFFRIYAAMTSNFALAANNLAGAVRDQGRHAEAIEILREAIGQTPADPNLWNTLGTIVVETGDVENATTFYQEALRLCPKHNRAQHNLAMALQSLGRAGEAVAIFDSSLRHAADAKDRIQTRYARSQALLASGRLAEGWAEHEARFDPRFSQALFFETTTPRWKDESFAGKNVLLIGEQGLGDEVLFLSAAPDLIEAIGPVGSLTIVVEKRLVPLIQRSFPHADVHSHVTVAAEGRKIRCMRTIEDHSKFDFYAPMASALSALRPDLASFAGKNPQFLTPDPVRTAEFKARLDAIPGPKAGLLWRSILMTSKRKRFYAPLEAWCPALEACRGTLIPMQYGDCAEEIALLKSWGLPIFTFDDLDMKDDLDGVAALSAALDLCVGPPNATTNIAAAVGAPVWILGEAGLWTRLGADNLPWYPRSRFFAADPRDGWGPALTALRGQLAAFGQ